MNRITSLVTLTAIALVAGNADAYSPQDVYFSLQNPPSEPIVDNAGAVTWGSDWAPVTLPWSWHFDVDQSLFLGLENSYVSNQTKTVTLDYVNLLGGAGVTGQTLAGFPPNTLPDKPWDTLTVSQLGPGQFKAVGTIFPQSSWEWIEVTGQHKQDIAISNYSSTCTPSPGVGAIVAVGSLFAIRRRR